MLHRLSVAPYAPTEDAESRARTLNDFVSSLQGGVVIPSHPFLARRNDVRTQQLLIMGYGELAMANKGADARRDIARLAPHWVVLTDPGPDDWMRTQLDDLYTLECRIQPSVATWATLESEPRLLYRLGSREGAGVTVQNAPPCGVE